MAYQITIHRNAMKALVKINEPYYSNIKKAIYQLGKIQDRTIIKN